MKIENDLLTIKIEYNMAKEVFSLSEKAKLEYSCTVVQIGEVKPVEGSDFLAATLVNGNPIVVRKDMIKEGDIMVYAPIETVLNKDFLSKIISGEIDYKLD